MQLLLKNKQISFWLRLNLCLILMLSISCDRILKWLDEEEIVYENSFESPDDAEGWEGITSDMFVDDPAPGSGDLSLNIGGGCIQPAAHLILPKFSHAGFYRIKCWGKVEESYNGGSIKLVNNNDEIEILVRNQGWQEYQSEETLYCSAGQLVTLELWIGGIVADFMKVDAIQIIRE